jgi:SNF2 family DNA or RNA helicase
MEKETKIWVEPRYTFKEKYKKFVPTFYGDWVYLEGEGFFQIMGSHRLPEKVREPLWIAPDDAIAFIENELDDLEPWVQKIDPRLVPPVYMRLILSELEEAKYYSWTLDLYYLTERGQIPIKTVIEAIQKKKKYLFLPEGRLNLGDERFQWIRRLRPESIVDKHKLNLSTIELIRLHAFEDIGASPDATRLFQEVIELKKTPPFDCTELKSSLRPYQVIGAEWLFSLYHYMLGGLLCDEMGLGKTHQSMALIAALRKIKPNAKFLVACPTSVLYHWEDKLRDFFPSLTIKTHHGSFRSKEETIEADLFLTSYGILRSDIDWIKKHAFDVAFFDEIQVAKNHRSKLYFSLKQVAAEVKIGLTGTPLENKLRELKALFDLVLPGYMPHEADYNRLIVRPIEKMRDMEKKSLLQRLTHPFILRRKKIDVLRDLPEKTEAIAHCELSKEQDQLYRETLLIQGDVLLHDIMDVKKAVPFLHVFSLLSRLKQICDHPALYMKEVDSFDKYQSGKWDLFVELLQEARESQQKVVVYSQYLGMLDIIEKYLKSEGIGFASLRGSTRDRKEQIALFASDPTCEVFVASLKAAGLGIDLTSASVVIHYDRWWNAARENQATDRVHRYGQSRGVQVFKLVTKNTFEERIDQIIERKKDLLDTAVAFDDHEVMKSFTRDELFELLQYNR